MVKTTVNVSINELDAMENKTTCWIACDKHNGEDDEEKLWKFTQTCKKCIEMNQKVTFTTLHLWSKLMSGYLEATKKKSKKGEKI